MDSDGEQPAPPKRRPFCPRCSKPARVCLCSRLPGPPIDNAVGVTVLQHTREKDHPLNSTRVAALGLRNLDVVLVSDVNFHAEFAVVPLPQFEEPCADRGVGGCSCSKDAAAARSEGIGFAEEPPPAVVSTAAAEEENTSSRKAGRNCSAACSSDCIRISIERDSRPDLGWVLRTPLGKSAASRGFTVQKIQTKPSPLEPDKPHCSVEFDIRVPPGSALLFPGKASVALNGKGQGFKVRHLFVLDGTWAKARRMYYENPWLQLLPRVKLETDEASLYREVRHQPKAGCLSTVESIVLALKVLAAGDDGLPEHLNGLDGLLEVFASMIRDQVVLKEDRFERMGLIRGLDGGESSAHDEVAEEVLRGRTLPCPRIHQN